MEGVVQLSTITQRGLMIMVLSVIAGGAVAQEPTLPERARRHRTTQAGPLYISRFSEPNVLSPPELAQRADLIVEGSVRVRRTYLAEREHWLHTEYEVMPAQVIAQSRPRVPQLKPGPSPILIEQSGGRAVFDGVEVVVLDKELPLLPTNEPLVLFLTYDQTEDRYRILGGVGAFAVKGARIEPLLRYDQVATQFAAVSHDQFIRDIQREVQARGGRH
jgi:hypothetical protein